MQRNRVISDDIMASIPFEQGMSAVEWLAEQMPGGFFIYRADESMELLYVNHSTCEIYGCNTVDEFRALTGNSFQGMVHPKDYDSIQTSIDEQISRPTNSRSIDYVTYRIIRKDGSIRWVDDYGHFATLPGYGAVYYVFIEDITENRTAAAEKERAQNLAFALEQAEHASLSKTAFLSNMSHEIRTPITAILGMNEMIQRETDNSVILDYSENIRKAGISLLGIISDILDFSKIESGKMILVHEAYSLRSAVADLYNLVQFRAESKGLELNFYLDPSLPSQLCGDEIRVKQIVTNLLTNAVKYTESGKVDFEIRLKEKRENSVDITVSVTDTGIGIRAEDMERLYEPFDRIDLKKTRSIEGTGLGLSITRQLLSLMNSELKVYSEYAKGSEFSFVLTQQVSDWTPVGEFNPDVHIHGIPNGRSKHALFSAPGMKLLVVDDTPMNLQVIAGLLKRTRMHIDVATSGAECIEKFGHDHYDLVFLDYRMPQMNGIETLIAIRQKYPDKFEKTPIISLTASAVTGDKEKMIRAGFTDYLAKPINIDEMERMMIKYLPQDSIVLNDENAEDGEDDELSKLPKIIFDYPQLDPIRGMEYCGDAEDYLFALETYAISIDAKAEQIEQDFKNSDFEALALNIHSLKSTSGAIGAVRLSENAKETEFAAKAGDKETLTDHIPALLEEYRQLKDVLNTILKDTAPADESSHISLAVVEKERSKMLARALDEAKQANFAKTAFLSNLSHAIRTPMSSIIGLYNIALRNHNLDAKTQELISQIGENARQLVALIDNILDMSLIESGSMKLKRETFSFGDMIEQINSTVEAQCTDKALSFDCYVTGSTSDYYIGDDMKLKQAIFNVLGNAVRYTPPHGKILFTVDEISRGNGKAVIRFVVQDTGVGIRKESLPHLFEPFSTETDNSADRFGNTGLGLVITKNIVDMMDGNIDVRSEVGKGSTFTMTIPLGICSEEETDKYSFDPSGIRALIVDDDVTACEYAKMILRRIGVESQYVLSGKDALSLFRRTAHSAPFNLVLTDWKMPEMDGIELIKQLRKESEHRDVAIILTTYNWYEVMEKALDAGADGFLSKPVFTGIIRKELGKILAEKKKDFHKPRRERYLCGHRVLIAEDVEINGQITKQILGLNDIEAELVSNGAEALACFENHDFGYYDAILMDIRMPKMDGLEAARQIRRSDHADAETIPIIALTGNAFEEDVQLSLESGMNAHLSKPVEPDALFKVLKQLILKNPDKYGN